MNILLSGTQEHLGVTLLHHLFACGHTLTCLQTRDDQSGETIWDIERLWRGRTECPYDAVIHLGGENLFDRRWNQSKKQRIQESCIEGTRMLVDFFWSQPAHLRPATLISASSVGYYGNVGERLLTEGNLAGMGFFANVCKHWERQALRAVDIGMRVLCLRIGMLLSPEDGLLPKFLPLFRVGLGGVFGSGKQYQSWISVRDFCRAVAFVLDKPAICGPVNLVTPKPVTNREFADTLATVFGKSARAPVPVSLLRLFFGEMADALLLASQRVRPDRLLQAGFVFADCNFASTVAWCAGRAQPPVELPPFPP